MGCLKQSNETVTLFDLSSSHVYDSDWLTVRPVATKTRLLRHCRCCDTGLSFSHLLHWGLVLLDLISKTCLPSQLCCIFRSSVGRSCWAQWLRLPSSLSAQLSSTRDLGTSSTLTNNPVSTYCLPSLGGSLDLQRQVAIHAH